jgi:hypothetical protein
LTGEELETARNPGDEATLPGFGDGETGGGSLPGFDSDGDGANLPGFGDDS